MRPFGTVFSAMELASEKAYSQGMAMMTIMTSSDRLGRNCMSTYPAMAFWTSLRLCLCIHTKLGSYLRLAMQRSTIFTIAV